MRALLHFNSRLLSPEQKLADHGSTTDIAISQSFFERVSVRKNYGIFQAACL